MSTASGACGRCRRPMVGQRATVVPAGAVRNCARGLCTGCHSYLARHDNLADFERATRFLDDTITEYRAARTRLDHNQIAAQLGMKPASLKRQLERSRARARVTCRQSSRTAAREDDLVL